MLEIAKSKNANSDLCSRSGMSRCCRRLLGRRGHVINVISSTLILLISCGVVGAQQILLPPQPPATHLDHQQQLASEPSLGSLQPDQEAYVFSSSFDTERDRIDELVRQWAPLVWLAPGEKFMPSSVTDFLHHVHAEKSKNPVKKKKKKNQYPANGDSSTSGSEEDDGGGEDDDRDNEHELYLLHQHQQQLSEKITAQLLRQRQQQQNQMKQRGNRRNSDDQTGENNANLNPWERRNKRTYHDENLLMDYIIDMPVGENSENWNLVTNDDLEILLEKPSSFVYGLNPSMSPVPIYAMISACPPVRADDDLPISRPPPFQPASTGVDQSVNEIGNNVEYKHNPYIPTNMDYFTSNDALHIKYTADQESHTEQFGAEEKVADLNPVGGNELELGQRRKREAVQVVMAESVQSYDGNLNINNNLYSKNTAESQRSAETNDTAKESSLPETTTTSSTQPSPISVTTTTSPGIGSVEWSVLMENANPPGVESSSHDWTPQSQNQYHPRPMHPTPPRTILYPKPNPNFDFQTIKRKIENQKRNPQKNGYPHFHVTYWLFYPYSQGKTMCSISLGPLGRVPIPLIFGVCLGTRKDFGSHIGDWEHMSLSFRGRAEPEEMYVSAHDAGAYYEYDRFTGTFDFRSQETRVGILQKPVFPRSVLTSNKHPVLFAAKGSHGLWTAPGKHKFVRVPRLYDINGFGIPWTTWKNTEIIYTDDVTSRSFSKHWIQFQGRWGNAKSKCHPLKRIGLHFCEFSDGPKGITNRLPHFQCAATPPATGGAALVQA